MAAFADEMLVRFLQNGFVDDLLKNQLGLSNLLNVVFELQDIEIKEVTTATVGRKQFQMPVFETIRTTGMRERLMPSPERVKIDESQPRTGRLAWVDVLLEVNVLTKAHNKVAPIKEITVKSLIEKLGGVSSINDLRNKLKALYPDSVVDAFFKQMRITSVEQFEQRGNYFIEFIYKTPTPFDPDDPNNVRTFDVDVCVQFQPQLAIAEALQAAKLSRSIMENEREARDVFDGGEIITPHAFVVIFPDSVAVDNAIPGLTAAQIKANVKALFAAERMFAHFFV